MENKKMLLICLDMDPISIQGDQHTGAAHLYVKESLSTLGKLNVDTIAITRLNDKAKPTFEVLSETVKLIRLHVGNPQVEPKEFFWGKEAEIFNKITKCLNDLNFVPDVVHSVYWYSGKVGLMVADAYKIPHVYSVVSLGKVKRIALGTDPNLHDVDRENTEQKLFEKSDLIFSVCEQEKRNLIRLYPNIEENKIVVIGRGVDPDLFKPQMNKIKPVKNPDDPYLFFAGRLIASKGLAFLMRVYLRLLKDETLLKKPRIIIAGGNPSEVEESQSICLTAPELIKAYNLGDISWLGIVPRNEMPRLYSGALLTCLPSVYEPAARVILESMASGTPVIMTETGYSEEVVKSGINGYVAPYGDEITWAEYIKSSLRSTVWHSKLVARTRESVIPYFSLNDFSHRQATSYENLWSKNIKQSYKFLNMNLEKIHAVYPHWEVPDHPQNLISSEDVTDWCYSLGINTIITEVPVSLIASSKIFSAQTSIKSFVVKQPKPKMLFYKLFYPTNPFGESDYQSTYSRWYTENLFTKDPLFKELIAKDEAKCLLLAEEYSQNTQCFDQESIMKIFELVTSFQRKQSERFSHIIDKFNFTSHSFVSWDDFWEYDIMLNQANSFFRGGANWFSPAQAEVELQRCKLALETGVFPLPKDKLSPLINQNISLLESIKDKKSKLSIVWGGCRPGHFVNDESGLFGIDAETCHIGQSEIDYASFLWWFIDLRGSNMCNDRWEIITNIINQMDGLTQRFTLSWFWLKNLYWLWWDIARSRKDRIDAFYRCFDFFETYS